MIEKLEIKCPHCGSICYDVEEVLKQELYLAEELLSYLWLLHLKGNDSQRGVKKHEV